MSEIAKRTLKTFFVFSFYGLNIFVLPVEPAAKYVQTQRRTTIIHSLLVACLFTTKARCPVYPYLSLSISGPLTVCTVHSVLPPQPRPRKAPQSQKTTSSELPASIRSCDVINKHCQPISDVITAECGPTQLVPPPGADGWGSRACVVSVCVIGYVRVSR